MTESTLFDCTAYYPYDLKALVDYIGAERVEVESDAGGIVFHAMPEDIKRAKVEASARVDLSAWDSGAGSIGIGWNKSRWKTWPWAPWGIGSRVNALVPWRDVASNSMPFGTQLIFPAVSGYPELRGVLYVADAFGGSQPDDRLDLFFARPGEKFRREIRARVLKPWEGTEQHPIDPSPALGAQQCLNLLAYEGANGQPLKADGIPGPQTMHAFTTWAAEMSWPYGPPPRIRPEDPECYFKLRRWTKALSVVE